MPPIFTISWRRFIKAGWLTLGLLSLALGTAGIVLPLLPTVPFYMLTVFALPKGQIGCTIGFGNLTYIKNTWQSSWKRNP